MSQVHVWLTVVFPGLTTAWIRLTSDVLERRIMSLLRRVATGFWATLAALGSTDLSYDAFRRESHDGVRIISVAFFFQVICEKLLGYVRSLT